MPAATPVRIHVEGIQPILRVEDMQASLRFYVDVLGFTNASWGNDDFTRVNHADGAIYLCRGDQRRGGARLWIRVDDVERLHQQLKERGIPIRSADELLVGLRNAGGGSRRQRPSVRFRTQVVAL